MIRRGHEPGSSGSKPPSGLAAVESSERIDLGTPLVPATTEGARALGEWYWDELARASRGLVRARPDDAGGVRLVLGGVVALFRFGAAEALVDGDDVVCRHPILGGALASRPGGALTVAQRGGVPPQLDVTVTDYRPRLADRGMRFHRGLLYTALQAPLHRSVSRRFLRRTARRAA